MKRPKIYLSTSSAKGLGVFAAKNMSKGDIIEICPIMLIKTRVPELEDYLFLFDNNTHALALGYGSMYNHNNNPTAEWNLNRNSLTITALQDIKKNSEIFISYGNDYWTSRNAIPL